MGHGTCHFQASVPSPALLGSPRLCRDQEGMWNAVRAGMKVVAPQWEYPLELPCPGQSTQAGPSFSRLHDAPGCALCRGLGKHPPLSLHPSVSVSPSLLPSLHLFHCTSSCPALRLPALCLPALFPFPCAGAGPATPHHRLHTPGRMALALLLSSPSELLSSTSELSPQLAGSVPPFPPGICLPLAPSAL